MASERHYGVLTLAVTAASVGALRIGFDLGVLNPCLKEMTRDLQFTAAQEGVVMTSLIVAAAFGALSSGKVADSAGLVVAQSVTACLFLVGSVAAAAAHGQYGFVLMFSARCLSGLGCGASTVVCPRYIADVSPPRIRGALTSFTQLAICAGILIAFALGLPYEHGVTTVKLGGVEAFWWQVEMLLGALLPISQLVLLCFCPESPAWLLFSGQHVKAEAASAALHGPDKRSPLLDKEAVQAEAMAVQVLQTGEGQSTVEDPLLPPAETSGEAHTENIFKAKYRLMLVLSVGIFMFQQLGGINVIIYYSAGILAQAHFHSPVLATVGVGVVNLAMTIVSAAVVDGFGRRILWLGSHAGCAISLAVMATVILWQGMEKAAMTSVFCMLAFVASFAIGAGPIPWVYLNEILPPEIQGSVGAIATSLNWASNSAIAAGFPPLVAAIGTGNTFAVLAAVNTAAVIFGLFLMQETKQLTVEQIYSRLLL